MSSPRAVPRAHWTEREDQFLGWVIDRAHWSLWIVAHQRPGRTVHGWRTAWQADGAGFPDLVLVRVRVVADAYRCDCAAGQNVSKRIPPRPPEPR